MTGVSEIAKAASLVVLHLGLSKLEASAGARRYSGTDDSNWRPEGFEVPDRYEQRTFERVLIEIPSMPFGKRTAHYLFYHLRSKPYSTIYSAIYDQTESFPTLTISDTMLMRGSRFHLVPNTTR